jgi:hypothetical protein
MSNRALIEHMQMALASARAGALPLQSLAQTIKSDGHALEGMPYPLIRELDSLWMGFEVAAWADEDGFVPDTASLFERMERCLISLPSDPSK